MKKATVVFLIIGLGSIHVLASGLDLATVLNARSNAMASAGIAGIRGGVATIANPAGLANTESVQFEATLNNMFINQAGPAQGPLTHSETMIYGPLFLIGGSYRLNDKIVLGVGAYTPAGGGAVYEDVNFNIPTLQKREFGGSIVFSEISAAISYQVNDKLALGAGYRLNYAMQSMSMYDFSQMAQGLITYNEIDLSGGSSNGYRLALEFKATPRLTLAAVYRSAVELNLSGTTTISDSDTELMELDTESTAKYCDRIDVGATFEWIEDKFLVALDYSRNFYSQYENVTLSTKMGTQSVPMMFSDCDMVKAGAEYWVTSRIPFRAGLFYGSKFQNVDYHTAISAGAPGAAYLLGMGTGYCLSDMLCVNFAFNYMINTGSVPSDVNSHYAVPGDYESTIMHYVIDFSYGF
jgi:long-chain fatty acid transport protein